MTDIEIYEHPDGDFSNLIFAFSGWSDANGTATYSVSSSDKVRSSYL